MSGRGEPEESTDADRAYDADAAALFRLRDLSNRYDDEKAKGEPSTVIKQVKREGFANFLRRPAFAGMTQEQAELLVRAVNLGTHRLTEDYEGLSLAYNGLKREHDEATRKYQDSLIELQQRADPQTVARLIDADVVHYAGVFEKALQAAEDLMIEVGVTAKAVWKTMRTESYEIFCTDSRRYATARKIGKESLSLATFALTYCLLDRYELPTAVANGISKTFLVVCDGGREKWCSRYDPTVLVSSEELAVLRKISQRSSDDAV